MRGDQPISLKAPFTLPPNVELTARIKNDQPILCVLNHNTEAVTVELDQRVYGNLLNGEHILGRLALGGYDVAILTV